MVKPKCHGARKEQYRFRSRQREYTDIDQRRTTSSPLGPENGEATCVTRRRLRNAYRTMPKPHASKSLQITCSGSSPSPGQD